MKKHFWDKSCRYSIRKLTVGTASVLLGAVFLVNHTEPQTVLRSSKLNQPLSKLSLSLIVNPKLLKLLKLQNHL